MCKSSSLSALSHFISYGAIPSSTQLNVPVLEPGALGKASLTVAFGGDRSEDRDIQIALKTALGVAVFSVPLPFLTTLLPRYVQRASWTSILIFRSGKLDTQTFASLWKQQQTNEAYFDLGNLGLDTDTVSGRLQENNIFYVTKADKEGSVWDNYSETIF